MCGCAAGCVGKRQQREQCMAGEGKSGPQDLALALWGLVWQQLSQEDKENFAVACRYASALHV